ncbi:MAG: ATP-binding cassette domain-containing protein [Acidobacteria bacterium]|nr:ATP-binding cassette domain-containing protein [Acidobacteriota bacterium]
MSPAVVDLSDVSKGYGALRPLRIASLSIAAGESVAILGLDRPAAEILINLLTGATLPERGEVHVFGRSTASISDSTDWLAVVDRFGIVSERAVLLDQLSVIQNIAVPFTLEIEPPPDSVRKRAEALAKEVGLAESAAACAVGALEASARARVRLARAIALDPAVLLIEHLSAGVPRAEVAPLGESIRSVAERRGAAIVALTGDVDFAGAVAQRILTLEPATGRLRPHGRRGWLGGRLG